jgi:hypothetical protein
MTLKDLLRKMNKALFENRQPSVIHEIYVTGARKKNTEGKVTIAWLQTSNPNAKAAKAGVEKSKFIHASFKPVGTVKSFLKVNIDAEIIDDFGSSSVLSGPKQPQIGNVFLSNQPTLYNMIKTCIERGEYRKEATGEGENKKEANPEGGYIHAWTDKKGRPVIKIRDKIFGRIVVVDVPEYRPTSVNAQGDLEPLAPKTYDPETQEYTSKNATMSVIKFFADDDDLDALAETAAKVAKKKVVPFMVEKMEFSKETSVGDEKVTVETSDNATADPDDVEENADTNPVNEETNEQSN